MVCQAEIRELTGMLQRSYKRKMRSSRLLILDIYTSQKASTASQAYSKDDLPLLWPLQHHHWLPHGSKLPIWCLQPAVDADLNSVRVMNKLLSYVLLSSLKHVQNYTFKEYFFIYFNE